MALQGDLHSFALPDVLRLLAGTQKSGRLDVAGDGATGEVWFDAGELVGGEVTSSPHASRSADVVFELLRFENGTFRFDEGSAPADATERSAVEDAIEAAEDLIAQWAIIERVVPSVHSWVELADQIETETVTVTDDQWRLVASIATGATSRMLGDRFEMTDLEATGRVKELVELGVVEVGDIIEVDPAPVADLAPFDTDVEPDDLYQLAAEDRPVVLETRDDALLPEPLPGEGTSFVGDISDLGTVDGRQVDHEVEAGFGEYDDLFERGAVDEVSATEANVDLDVDLAEYDESTAEVGAEAEAEADGEYAEEGALPDPPLGFAGSPVPEAPPAVEAVATDEVGESDASDQPDEEALDRAWSSYGSLDGVADEDVPPPPPAPDGPAAGEESDDRGSLLRFLSSVKP